MLKKHTKFKVISYRENSAVAVEALHVAGKALLGDFDEEALAVGEQRDSCITALIGTTPLIST